MITITLSPKQVKLLKEYLSLDLERIGFDEKAIKVLESIQKLL